MIPRRLAASIAVAVGVVAAYLGVVALLHLDPDLAGGEAWGVAAPLLAVGGIVVVSLSIAVGLMLGAWWEWVRGDD